MKLKYLLSVILLSLIGLVEARGQDVAIKTDLLKDIVLTPTVSAEFGIAPKWTIEGTAELNAWAVKIGRAHV